jgi:hypothetical protein
MKNKPKTFIYEFGPLTKDWALPYQESFIRALASDAIKKDDIVIVRRKINKMVEIKPK